jgi:hypothetical protein
MQLEKPWVASRVHHLTLTRAYNTYKPSRWENPSLLHQYVDAKSAYQFYVSIFVPSVTYPFPTNTIPERPLITVQNAFVCPIQSRMGLARNNSRAIFMAPSPSAELAFDHSTRSKDRPTLLKHSRSSTMVTAQLHIHWRSVNDTSGYPPQYWSSLPRLCPTWKHPFSVVCGLFWLPQNPHSSSKNCHVTPLQRIGDFHLMDRVLQSNQFTNRQYRQVNYCRLFLQVHTSL